jgi:hypothetical protein
LGGVFGLGLWHHCLGSLAYLVLGVVSVFGLRRLLLRLGCLWRLGSLESWASLVWVLGAFCLGSWAWASLLVVFVLGRHGRSSWASLVLGGLGRLERLWSWVFGVLGLLRTNIAARVFECRVKGFGGLVERRDLRHD